MRRHVVEQPQRVGAEMRDQPRRRTRGPAASSGTSGRATAARTRRSPRVAPPSQRREAARAALEDDRVGALEAEDRLLEVADREQRAQHARPARPRPRRTRPPARSRSPTAARWCPAPRRQDMVGALVELVAHPLAHAGLLEQLDGRADQIVEIDRRRPRAWRADRPRHSPAPARSPAAEQIGISGACAQRQQPAARVVAARAISSA